MNTLICGLIMYSAVESVLTIAHFLFSLGFQQYSFYELIVNKARGKSGPVILIFCFLQFAFLLFLNWKQKV